MIRSQYEGYRAFALGCGLIAICGCVGGGAAGDSGDSGQPPIKLDTGTSDTSARDTRAADTASPDVRDAQPQDAQPQDTRPSDMSLPRDAPPPDAPPPDAQPRDTRPPDTALPPPDSAVDTAVPDSTNNDTGGVPTKPCKPGVGWATGVTFPAGAPLPTWQPQVQPGLSTAKTAGQACTGPRSGSSAVLCVDDDNSTGSRAGTATSPYRTIQAAIDAAADGDLVQVAGGTYGENLVIHDKSLRLVGGFAGAASYGSSAGDFITRIPAQYITTVEGQGGGSAIDILSANPAVIDGLRIIKGTGNEAEALFYYLGGGVCVGEATVTIRHCLIEDNDIVTSHPDKAMASMGGAVQAADSRVTLYANIIRNNRSGRGAVAMDGPQARVEGNAIIDNVSVGDHGGGLYLSGADMIVLDNLVARNRLVPKNGQGGWGGGIMVLNPHTQALLQGNVVVGNSAPFQGSGVFIDDAAKATLVNELIYANACTQLGGSAVYVDADDSAGASTATMNNVTIAGHVCSSETGGNALLVEDSDVAITNSIIWANGSDDFALVGDSSLTVDHSIATESVSGDNNQRVDPIFADPPEDFHLCSTGGRYQHDGVDAAWEIDKVHSPAIDSGDPAAAVGSETQPNGSQLNRGAYGGTAQASRSD